MKIKQLRESMWSMHVGNDSMLGLYLSVQFLFNWTLLKLTRPY